MISKLRPTLGRLLSEPIVRILSRTGVSPNALTVTGFLLSAVTAWVLATGHLFLGGFLVLFSAWFDMLDGALAKMIGMTTRFGALLDSTVDRFSEAVLFLGLLIHYADRDEMAMVVLIYVAIMGSQMVSYTRARAEGLGLKAEVGILARPERIVLLTLGLLLTSAFSGALVVIMWILAVGTNLTALYRLLHSRRQSRGDYS
jgi:CDP-diacylglycerol--glycerol-3-phosphate 3-phosphatidyltransferase